MQFPRLFFLMTTVALTVRAECPMAAIRARQAGTSPTLKRSELPDEETETNCGPIPCGKFNPKTQYVDVRPGSLHEYRAPSKDDKRGPCPGLNAAANHGFIRRDGITDFVEATEGVFEAFGMGKDLGSILAIAGVGLAGDALTMRWSIGGPFSPLLPSSQQPSGLNNTHNTYEGDGSATRADAYANNGDGNSLNLTRFKSLYDKANAEGNITPTIMRSHSKEMNTLCRTTNGYCFFGPFAGIVAPAAAQFIPNFMSSHSDEQTLISFHGVSIEGGSFVYNPGTERIPYNWYRRSPDNAYGVEPFVLDALILARRFPELFSFGGNTGKPNTFTGVDIGKLTGGVYNAITLFEGNNLACFCFQVMQSQITGRLGTPALQPLLDTLKNLLQPLLAPLACPQLAKYNQTIFEQFPGFVSGPSKGA